jgi:predicted CXXCH cytochrome family protein
MRGGLSRLSHTVSARAREAPTALALAGDVFFRGDALTAAQAPQEKLKARTLAEAFSILPLEAVALGERDLAGGEQLLRDAQLPLLAEGQTKLVALGSLKVGLVAGRTAQALTKGARVAQAEGARFIVGLVHQDAAAARGLAEALGGQGVDLLVASHGGGEFDAEDSRLTQGPVPVAQAQSKGRALIRLELYPGTGEGAFRLERGSQDEAAALRALEERVALLKQEVALPGVPPELKRLKQAKLEEVLRRREALALPAPAAPNAGAPAESTFEVSFVALEPTTPEHPAVRALVERYDREVAALNLASAQASAVPCPPPRPGEAAFVGNATCQGCHPNTVPVWTASAHARAYATLEEKSKQFDLDCVACHVTGMNAPGGVCRVDAVEGRRDVGCESCHGPGSLHAAAPTAQKVVARPGAQMCVGCHNPENSPHFDFAAYLPRVLGPGHGRPWVP